MINKVQLIGNLGANPETRTTKSGSVVATLRVATSERVKDGDGWKDHTEWHSVVCFGRTAENVAKFLEKGRMVYVEGKLRTSSWESDGVKKWKTEIVADDIKFLGGGGGGGSQATTKRDDGGYGKPDDDLPF